MKGLAPTSPTMLMGVTDPAAKVREAIAEFLAALDAGDATRAQLDAIFVAGQAALTAVALDAHRAARAVRVARDTAKAEALAAERERTKIAALSGPPAEPEGEEARELHAVGLDEYRAAIVGTNGGPFAMSAARRAGWEAMLARYRRITRPGVARVQAEERLRAMGLDPWARWD